MSGETPKEISPELRAQLDHMAGVGCVLRFQYGNRLITRPLETESLAGELWQELAFTNGPPLVRIVIEYAPDEARKFEEAAKAAEGQP